MPKTTKERSDQPTIEELLRFKKAERPDEAFWDRFDRDLHQRMMQTLVKKEPWPTQLLRALSGRLAQGTAVAAALVLIAMMVVRPALVPQQGSGTTVATTTDSVPTNQEAVDSAEPELQQFTAADYGIDVVSAADLQSGSGVKQEYHMDRVEVASYDAAAYSTDRVASGTPNFTASGVALVF